MTASEDPLRLIEELRQKYGVDESEGLYGPSVIVPNSEYHPEWTRLLSQAGFKVFSGSKDGRVAWVIPLKARPNTPEPDLIKDPSDGGQGDPETGSGPKEGRGRGCITGRPWTEAEDKQILEMLDQDEAAKETARILAARLYRTEEAIKGRIRKLRRRLHVEPQSTVTHEEPGDVTAVTREAPRPEPGAEDLLRLLGSALLLAEDPRHKPALKLVLEACLRKVT